MRWLWEVDDRNKVTAKRNLGGASVSLNGREVFRAWRTPKHEIHFDLDEGRRASVKFRVEHLSHLRADLTVNGQRMIATDSMTPKVCSKCRAPVQPNTRFCERCGHALPTAEELEKRRNVKEAASIIRVIAIMFAVFGVIMYLVARGQASDALQNLAQYNDTDVWSIPINGQTVTVGQLRQQVEREAWSVLGINFLLAAIMWALAVWAKRAPLPAIIAAAATYAVIMVMNAVVDPTTIAQGIILKIIIVALFVKGIRSAIELRAANA